MFHDNVQSRTLLQEIHPQGPFIVKVNGEVETLTAGSSVLSVYDIDILYESKVVTVHRWSTGGILLCLVATVMFQQ